MPQLANFENAAQLGFESGKGMASENPLGQFIRNMLQNQQQSQQLVGQATLQKGMLDYKMTALKEIAGLKNTGGTSKLATLKKQIYSQASADAFKEAGGSMMMGFSGKGKELNKTAQAFEKRRKELYTQYMKEFGINDTSMPNELSLANDLTDEEDASDFQW
jgi:hypothetical protein